jgi:hypothetical protein
VKQLHICKNKKFMAKDHQLLENSCAKALRVPGLALVFLPLPDSVPLVQGQELV